MLSQVAREFFSSAASGEAQGAAGPKMVARKPVLGYIPVPRFCFHVQPSGSSMNRLARTTAVLLVGLALSLLPAPGAAQGGAATSNAWPRVIAVGQGSLEIFQPQIESLQGDLLAARTAVAWTPPGSPVQFGVVWLESRVSIDKVSGDVALAEVKVVRVRFPNVTPEEEQRGRALLEKEIPTWDLHIPLVDIQASLAVRDEDLDSSGGLDFTPPQILFSQEPAVLLLYDGAPIEHDVPNSTLRRVVNTPMLVLFDPATRRYYLSGGTSWYTAPAATGPFDPGAPSPAVQEFFERNSPPPDEETDPEVAAAMVSGPQPRVIVATEPTELILFDGPPRYEAVDATANLLYVVNSETTVLVHVPTSETYVLVSGRWFKARTLDGPWVNVRADQLPEGFYEIPPESAVGDARTFVAGTEEAEDAVADTFIPQTSEVRRDQTLQVTYDGAPRFEEIPGTPLAYALNTPDSVLRDDGRYWACEQGVWYAAPAAEGPWAVSDQRPPHVDQLPPSVPVYNVRYVYVYRSTPQVVFVGYTPGYVSVFASHGVVVFGTGFHYRPWVSPVVFIPRPATFGFRVVYNPWTGFGFVVGPSTRFVTVGVHFGPRFGPRPVGWWGPVAFHPVVFFPPPRRVVVRPPPGRRPPPPSIRPPQNPRPRPPGAVRPPGSSPGPRPPAAGRPPGSSPGPRPRDPVYNNRPRGGEQPRGEVARPSPRPVDRPNNVFGDRSGNVYRQDQRGNWERNTREGWQPEPTTRDTRPTAPTRPTSPTAPTTPQRPSPTPPGNATRPSPSPSPGGDQRQRAPGSGAGSAPGNANRGGNAPAGLGRDAAARQRSSTPPAPGRARR